MIDEHFVTLVATIEEDESLRSMVAQALELGPARKQFVSDLLLSLRRQEAPESLMNSLALLADDEVCNKLAILMAN